MEHSLQLNFPRLARERYEPVGLCIYCGAADSLTNEHIIPFGIGGNLVLPKSSCAACASVTSKFERAVLRGPFRPVRVFRRLQSRSRHRDAPTRIPLQIKRDGKWETTSLPHHEYPLLLDFLIFGLPGYLDSSYQGGLRMQGHATFSFGPRPEEVAHRLGATDIRITQAHKPTAFAQLTAKIAYSMAVAINAIDPRKGRPPVVRSILGAEDKIGSWIGTLTEPPQRIADVLHTVSIHGDRSRGLLIGRVQYFTDSGTPHYGVILGDLSADYVRSAA